MRHTIVTPAPRIHIDSSALAVIILYNNCTFDELHSVRWNQNGHVALSTVITRIALRQDEQRRVRHHATQYRARTDVNTHARSHSPTHTHTCACTQLCTYLRTHVLTHTNIIARIYLFCTYLRTHVLTHTHINSCTYLYTHARTYLRTHGPNVPSNLCSIQTRHCSEILSGIAAYRR